MKRNNNMNATPIKPYPIRYRGNTISIEKARVLVKLKRGIVFPRTTPLEEELELLQSVVNTLTPEEQDTYYYVREKGGNLYGISYFNGLKMFVSEYQLEEYHGIFKLFATHEDGYWEFLRSFKTREEAQQYMKEH